MAPAAAAEAKHRGEHAMSGTVTDIDPQTGKLSLNSGVGGLELHFPPQALEDVKEGNQLTAGLTGDPSPLVGPELNGLWEGCFYRPDPGQSG